MGACILCGKSAGLFYSLHKNCYSRYQSAVQPIVDSLDEKLAIEPVSALAQNLITHVEQLGFRDEAKKRTLVRGLEQFSESATGRCLKSESACRNWLQLLDELNLNPTLFLQDSFLETQQSLLPIAKLHAGSIPVANCQSKEFCDLLSHDEQVLWRFPQMSLMQNQPRNNNAKYSVALQLIRQVIPEKKRGGLQQQNIWQGELWLTTQRLAYIRDAEPVSIYLSEIYAITPECNGVTLQLCGKEARPHRFSGAQGNLLYFFIEFVQANNRQLG